jgi:hypothetical protein
MVRRDLGGLQGIRGSAGASWSYEVNVGSHEDPKGYKFHEPRAHICVSTNKLNDRLPGFATIN